MGWFRARKAYAPRLQPVDQRHQLAREPPQPVEVEHHQHVARAQVVEALREPGRSAFAPEARSSNTRSQPAACSASIWRSSTCAPSLVPMRA